jgi:hypothetical protein
MPRRLVSLVLVLGTVLAAACSGPGPTAPAAPAGMPAPGDTDLSGDS